MEIKVSIIVPVYNAELFIERCIKSIREQTYTNIEIILVNDGSTDNSESILMDLAQTDPRIVDVKQKNQGVSAARNTGTTGLKKTWWRRFCSRLRKKPMILSSAIII